MVVSHTLFVLTSHVFLSRGTIGFSNLVLAFVAQATNPVSASKLQDLNIKHQKLCQLVAIVRIHSALPSLILSSTTLSSTVKYGFIVFEVKYATKV